MAAVITDPSHGPTSAMKVRHVIGACSLMVSASNLIATDVDAERSKIEAATLAVLVDER